MIPWTDAQRVRILAKSHKRDATGDEAGTFSPERCAQPLCAGDSSPHDQYLRREGRGKE